jgi:DNA-binding CsgD family transcriptional regulator/tetratricopeptide (TPR) repeat protein
MLDRMGGRLVSPTFVGRREALDVAAEMLARVIAGQPSHLLVAGEAGIGKTRLVQAVGDLAKARGCIVASGRSIPLGSGELPYAPIREALRALAADLDPPTLRAVLGADGPDLARITPGLGPEGPRRAASSVSGEARARVLEAFLGMVGRLARIAPVVLVMEDLQWADSASLDLLSFILRVLRDERVGLVLTLRTDGLDHRGRLGGWLGEVERLDAVWRVDVEPLTPAETRDLVAAIRGSEPTDDLVDRVVRRSDGNPLFVEELLAHDDARAGGAALPATLLDILRSRVATVPAAARDLLDVLAIAGGDVDVDLAAEVSDMPPDGFDSAVEASVARHLLVLERAQPPARLAFRHALIADVVSDSIGPVEMTRLHRAWAEALTGRATGPGSGEPGLWAEIAAHWDAARDEEWAFAAAIRAAGEAEHAYAFSAAFLQYRRALDGWGRVAEPEALAGIDRVDVLTRAANAAWLGGGEGQIPLLREAIELADRAGDVRRRAALQGRLGHAWLAVGDHSAARVLYDHALATMPQDATREERAFMLSRLAQARRLAGAFHEAVRVAEEAVVAARAVGDRAIEAHATNTLGAAAVGLGRCAYAAACLREAVAIAVEVGEPGEVGRAYTNGVEVLRVAGHDHEAIALGEEGMERLRAMGMEASFGRIVRSQVALTEFHLGLWVAAASRLERAFGPLDGAPALGATPSLALERAVSTTELYVATGAWDAVSTRLADVRGYLDRSDPDEQWAGPYATAAAEMALWQARPRDALEAVEFGLGRIELTDDVAWRIRLLCLGTRALADLAEVARDRRDLDARSGALAAAARLLERTEPATAEIAGMDGGLALELAAEVATTAGEETRLRGSSDAAAWHAAADLWLARERPYPRAYALWRAAEASLVSRDRPSATAALQAAAGIARRLGAAPLLREIEALARRARIRPEGPAEVVGAPPSGAGDPDPAAAAAAQVGLTAREREVLELIAAGLTNRQIADALFISVNTAGIHVSRILGKLGASTRTEAADIAWRQGIISR